MKQATIVFLALLLTAGCSEKVAEKPDNLIPEEQMIDIFYDLALLEAIRTQRPVTLQQADIQPTTYIYRKYKIDSLQFVNSNRYYASDLESYKKMYQEVSNRIESNKRAIDAELQRNGGLPSDVPQIQ